LKTSKWIVENEGKVSIGSFGPDKCAAVASDRDNMIAALQKRNNKSIEKLLNRFE